MARPTKYTEFRVNVILNALAQGATRKDAAAAASISDETFANWLKRYLDFLDQVTTTEAMVAIGMSGIIVKAAETDWRAAEVWLKKRRREEWGDSLDIRKLDDATILRLLEDD